MSRTGGLSPAPGAVTLQSMKRNSTPSRIDRCAAAARATGSILLVIAGLVIAGLAAGGLACSDGEEPLPESVSFSSPSLYPEGFGYDAAERRFLVSSVTHGDVFAVTPAGEIERFIADERLISSTGVTVDAPRGRAIVATGDVMVSSRSSPETAFTTAAIGIYDLNTGAPRDFIALGDLVPDSGHFASDAAVDDTGSIYVTDSFAPVIFRVDAAGQSAIFLQSLSFAPAMNQFGLNGLVYHPGGYLIAAKTDDGSLFKIPLADPESFSAIDVEAFPGVDGVALDGDRRLLLAVNGRNQIVALESDDGWATARKVAETATPDVFPTMVGEAEGDFFVLHSYLHRLLAGDTAHATYRLEKVRFR
jgi:sugar lactone lactonase YvrE